MEKNLVSDHCLIVSYLVRREDGFIFQRGPVRTRDWRRDRGEFFATTSATFAMAPEVGLSWTLMLTKEPTFLLGVDLWISLQRE